MTEKDYRELIGKRLLVRDDRVYPQKLHEHKIVEVSESGDYIKIEYVSSAERWLSVIDYEGDYKFIEVLPDTERKSVLDRGARRMNKLIV